MHSSLIIHETSTLALSCDKCANKDEQENWKINNQVKFLKNFEVGISENLLKLRSLKIFPKVEMFKVGNQKNYKYASTNQGETLVLANTKKRSEKNKIIFSKNLAS